MRKKYCIGKYADNCAVTEFDGWVTKVAMTKSGLEIASGFEEDERIVFCRKAEANKWARTMQKAFGGDFVVEEVA